MRISFILLSFISFFCYAAHGLKDLKIFVPEAVIMGNAATLSCQYDLNKVSETSLMDAEADEDAEETETETSLTLSTSTACLIIIITRTLSSLSFASIFLLHYFRLFILRASAAFESDFIFLFSLQAVLYSVRWYFNQAEFYRYVPREAKPTVVFAVSGINVDVSEIKHTIRSLTPKAFQL